MNISRYLIELWKMVQWQLSALHLANQIRHSIRKNNYYKMDFELTPQHRCGCLCDLDGLLCPYLSLPKSNQVISRG